jgi:hypothetical protein
LTHGHDTDEMLEDIDRKQRASTWPNTLEAGRSVDEFLWKGDPKATPVQRVGLGIFAVCFLFLFVITIVLIVVRHDGATTVVGLIMATISGIAGVRLLRNVFRRTARRSGAH